MKSVHGKKIVFYSHSNKHKYMKNSDICATYTVWFIPWNNTCVPPAGRRRAQPRGLKPPLYRLFWKTFVPINISGVTIEPPAKTRAGLHVGCPFLLHNCKQNSNA